MYGKIIAILAVVAAVASAQSCGYCGGYLPTSISGFGLNGAYESGVLNAGCAVPVVSAFPACSPVATPSQIVDSAVVAPTSAASVVSTPVLSSGLIGSRCYGGYGYGSTFGVSGNEVLATVF